MRRDKMITDNYIKMCEKAEEIQKQRIWGLDKRGLKNTDFIAYDCGEGLKVYSCFEISHYWNIRQDLIWLPTQKQLQKIWKKEYLKNPNRLGWFGCFIKFISTHYKDDLIADEYFKEINELWLAFIMSEKYHKIWNGKDWVKEG